MEFIFDKNISEKIIAHFGQDFYDKVVRYLEFYSKKWNLKIREFVEYYSINCIFLCDSTIFGDSVLKICRPSKEVYTESNILKEYNGRNFCKLFESDIENGVLLLEQIKPGIRLREEKDLDKRLAVFSLLFNDFHIKPANPKIYPTYAEWVKNITEYMSKRDDCKELYALMKKANDICIKLNSVYTKQMLLHGDFHHDNILLGADSYKIIDPKGVVGDPVFDIARFILNEFEDSVSEEMERKVIYIIKYFEKSLKIQAAVIKECLFIETAMANCWNVQSGIVPNLEQVYFSEKIAMDSEIE